MEWDSWFRNKSFTTDWSSSNYIHWARNLEGLRDRQVKVLEIGSWEGRSAIFFLEFLPKCRISCIDTFAGGPDYAQFDQAVVASIEARFDSNLAAYGDRVRKLKSRSVPALDQLAQENEAFDLVYIDGSHARDDVLVDSVLAWRLLAPDGTCIWDDYSLGLVRASVRAAAPARDRCLPGPALRRTRDCRHFRSDYRDETSGRPKR